MFRYKKLSYVVIYSLLFSIVLTSLVSSDSNPPIFEQEPPIPLEFWVQKVENPVNGHVLKLKVKFHQDTDQSEVKLYRGNSFVCCVKDDGVSPDACANDKLFTACVQQNADDFLQDILNRQNEIESKEFVTRYTGHIGELIETSTLTKFDKQGFNNFQEVQIEPLLIGQNASDGYQNIIKHKSLFITELEVVENSDRTYNLVTGEGNPIGAWTFGELMKNMAGGLSQNPTNEEILKINLFLKEWIKSLYEVYELNGKASNHRDNSAVANLLIDPWVEKAYGEQVEVTGENWENIWDDIDTQTEVESILQNAPFKLTAIVNRLDLRGNSAYSPTLSNAGETRFIFSLIDPFTGETPIHENINFDNISFLDWEGMNVILEYGNPETDKCDIKQKALDWIALSDYDWNNQTEFDDYLTALQLLTDDVTAVNANPSKPNGSAINQVRTNEKLFAYILPKSNWVMANWELRQFEIEESSGLLKLTPVTNVPFSDENYTRNGIDLNQEEYETTYSGASNIRNWIYGVGDLSSQQVRIAIGNHNLPTHLTQPTAEIEDELMHYYRIDFWSDDFSDGIYDNDNYTGDESHLQKEIRKQLSLNTCMGCHTSETKTPFMMIRPRGYGEPADYWSDIPSTDSGPFDNRFYGNANLGTTWDNYSNTPLPNYDPEYYTTNSTVNRIIPVVAPFLTGRNYRGGNDWEDDNYTNTITDFDNILYNIDNAISDEKITGLFYVNDPSNESDVNDEYFEYPVGQPESAGSPFPKLHDKQSGFNDLQRRQMDLYNLANSCCDPTICPELLTLVDKMAFIPLPKHSH